MADGVSDDGNGDEPLVLPTPASCTDVQSLITLLREEMRTNRQETQAQMEEMQDHWQQMSTQLFNMMLQQTTNDDCTNPNDQQL